MFPNAKLEIYTVDESSQPDALLWSGEGWTSGFNYGLDRKEPGEIENFKMEIRFLTNTPFNLAPGQRVKVEFDGETLLFNLVKIIRSLGGFTVIRLDTLP